MLLKSKFAIAVMAFLILCTESFAQQNNCNLSIKGTIICADDKTPLFAASVGLDSTIKSTLTDDKGNFIFSHLCAGRHHLKVSTLGYFKLDTILTISANKKIKFFLKPEAFHLKEAHIETNKIEKQEVQTITKEEISGEKLQQTRGEDLGDALKEISGVDVVHFGPTIAKPVIHGLYSNRILILNNGVRQEGQQWGSEHAPEIDPFIATKLSVIKGAASIRYGSDAIGGVVLVEPADMPKEKSLGGEINLVGMDNSQLRCGSGILQGAFDKKLSGLSYRIQGTYRRAGDLKTPTYYLDNTGLLETNYSGELSYNKEHFGLDVYYSHFYTKIGIFWGAEASNLSQLLQLFALQTPVINFGYSDSIKRGYQTVNHNLLKTSGYLKGRLGKLQLTFANQTDGRLEYDFDVPYSISNSLDNAPQNNYELTTQTTELIWEHNAWHNITGSIGGNFITQGNIYTGLAYAPVIPNFRNYGGGLFIIEKWNPTNNFTLEGGIRYDYKWQREYRLNPTSLQEFFTTQQYDASTATLGALYRISSAFSLNANAGSGWRAPSVYELYSYGVHGATQQFVVGDSLLKVEQSYNTTISLRYEGKILEAEIGTYVSLINNYIYLKPEVGKYQVTIDGFYPLFDFTQTNALFKGVDADVKWHITKHLMYEPKATLVFANDLTTHGYLVLIPPQRFQNTLEYRWKKLGGLKNVFINAGYMIVPEQTRVPPHSDFVPPPKGYSLVSAAIGCSVHIGKQNMNISILGNNLMNTVYRDYLDFFRYYANEPGRSIQLKIQIPFEIIKNNPVPNE